MTSPATGRAQFGPPANAPGAFLWSVVQLASRSGLAAQGKELRGLSLAPVAWTLMLGLVGAVGAVLGAGPLAELLVGHPGWSTLGVRAVLAVVLLFAVALGLWQAQGAIAAPALERMSLYVQKEVLGEAPRAQVGVSSVVQRAVLRVFPSLRRWVLWALTAALGLTLILVPVVGPLLVVIAQTTLAALFLAHGAITENRERLGLPRRLLLREPMGLLGLALACVPLVLVPPLLLFAGGTVQIAGALVALGLHRRASSRHGVGVPQDEH